MIKQAIAIFVSIAVFTIPIDIAFAPDLNANPVEMTEAAEVEVNEDDLYWLAKVIYAEAGADYCSDELQRAIGSVVLNRVNSELYPNSIKDVILDKHWGVQYGCTQNGMIYLVPNDRAYNNAEWLLRNGSIFPSNVLGQSDRVVLTGKYTEIQGVIFSYYGG